MPKQKETTNSDKQPRKRSPRYSKTKGNSYEQRIAKELRELGFNGVVTARSESKSKDDNKIDLVDTENKLPINIQLKITLNTPSYFKISEECTDKLKPFCIIWNSQEKKEKNICSKGEVVMVPKEFFYTLLKKYCDL